MKENWIVKVTCINNMLETKVSEELCDTLIGVSRYINVFKPKKGYMIERIEIINDWSMF